MLAILLLAACGDPPYVSQNSQSFADDGVHLSLTVFDIDKVTVLGQSVGHEEEFVIPWAQVQPGANRWPIEGKGLEDKWVYIDAKVRHLLRPACEGGESSVATDKSTPGDLDPIRLTTCPTPGGVVEVAIHREPGWQVFIDDTPVEGDTLRFDFTDDVRAMRAQGSSVTGIVKPRTYTLKVTGASGSAEEKVEVRPKGNLVDALVAAMPESTRGWPEGPRDLVGFRGGRDWWFEGSGATVGDTDVWLKVLRDDPPVPGKPCNFRDLAGGGVFTRQTTWVTRTFQAVDNQGNVLGEKTLSPTGCPGNAVDGDGPMELVPGESQVRAWAKSFL